MARTKSSRGVAPFKMRSGNSPLSLFGAIGMGINKLLGKNPKPPGGSDLKTQIEEIHNKVVNENGGGDENLSGDGVNVDTGGKSKIQAAIDAAGGTTDPKAIIQQLLKEKANETGETSV